MLYCLLVHGREEYYQIIGGEPYFLSKNKKGFYWHPTVVEPKRLNNPAVVIRDLTEGEEIRLIVDRVGFW